jgi:hypothetical protein
MNWLVVVFSGVCILCGLNWVFSAQYFFKGPKRFVDENEKANLISVLPSSHSE